MFKLPGRILWACSCISVHFVLNRYVFEWRSEFMHELPCWDIFCGVQCIDFISVLWLPRRLVFDQLGLVGVLIVSCGILLFKRRCDFMHGLPSWYVFYGVQRVDVIRVYWLPCRHLFKRRLVGVHLMLRGLLLRGIRHHPVRNMQPRHILIIVGRDELHGLSGRIICGGNREHILLWWWILWWWWPAAGLLHGDDALDLVHAVCGGLLFVECWCERLH